MTDRLYVVAECPVCPGFGGVVALLSATTSEIVFFAPCCGVAWNELPQGRIDSIDRLSDLAVDGLWLPSAGELRAAVPSMSVIREEPLENWLADIPGLVGRQS